MDDGGFSILTFERRPYYAPSNSRDRAPSVIVSLGANQKSSSGPLYVKSIKSLA